MITTIPMQMFIDTYINKCRFNMIKSSRLNVHFGTNYIGVCLLLGLGHSLYILTEFNNVTIYIYIYIYITRFAVIHKTQIRLLNFENYRLILEFIVYYFIDKTGHLTVRVV